MAFYHRRTPVKSIKQMTQIQYPSCPFPSRKRQRRLEREWRCFNKAQPLLDKWCQPHPCREIAIAELVRYVNKFVKRFPKYKHLSKKDKKKIDTTYQLKDIWLKQNQSAIVSAIQTAKFTNEWIDWDAFHWDKAFSHKWIDIDDYTHKITTQFFAYTLIIQGQEYRFHSKTKLMDDYTVDFDQHGRSSPLADEEITMPLEDAIMALQLALGQIKEPSASL